MVELPDGFNAFEHLQDTIRREHNTLVRKYFSDLGADWTPNIADARNSLRTAVQMFDDDTAEMTMIRLYLFYDVLGYGKKGLATFYGGKFDNGVPLVAGHPQLFLYFSQDSGAVTDGVTRVDTEKSCRLTSFACKTGESLPAITKADLTEIGREVKNLFCEGGRGIVYTCGKIAVSYTDPAHGFPKGNYWLVNNKTEGVELYQKLCNVVDKPFDENKIKVGIPEKNNLTQLTTQDTILGKKYKHRAYRPIANLRFRHAYVSFGSVIPPIFLVDTTHRNQSLVNF